MQEIKPKYVVVALDYAKKTFRNELFSEYKGKRKSTPEELKSQFPILRHLLRVMGICYIEKEGFEADDIIGTLTKNNTKTENIVITGDKDALQLIKPNTSVWLTKKGITETKVMTENSLMEEMGLKPYQVIELKSLMGDDSDNIPGVAGVGEKIAMNLLREYKNLENIYVHIDEIKGKTHENLVLGKDSAFLSKKLATIVCDVPIKETLKDFEYKFPFRKDVFDFFKNYEFNSIIKRTELFEDINIVQNHFEHFNAQKVEIKDLETLKTLISNIKSVKKFNFEFNDNIFSFAYDKTTEYFLKIQTNFIETNLDISIVLNEFKEILEDETIEKILYDIKSTKRILSTFNINLRGAIFDCILAYYLLNAGDREANMRNINTMYHLDDDYYGINLFCLKEKLTDDLAKYNMLELYNKIEFPLIEVLYDMEQTGFKIDVKMLEELSDRYAQEVVEMAKVIKNLAGQDFNINSPKQLGEILFDKLGLISANNKKKSTSMEFLQEMFDLHPIIPAIIRYRKVQKISTTYVESYKNIIKAKQSDIIHSIFNQTLTTTGRLSSSEPNLQNIPTRDSESKSLRKMFVSRYDNGVLISADYSQIELRLMAHLSGDEKLIDAFRNNIDVHSLTASEVFNVNIADITPEMRQMAKAVNFGIVYGISEYGLSQNINSSIQQAKKYIDAYFTKYPSIREYTKENVQIARATGYARSIFNRRRKISELFVPKTRMFGERIAMNMPLQGSASDIIKIAMINVYKALKEKNLKSKLVLQVHDELIVDTPQEEITIVAKILKDNMENVVKLSVPLTVDINSGKTWFDC